MLNIGTMAVLAAVLVTPFAAHAQQKVPVANEGDIRDMWTLAPGASFQAPGYPAQFAASGDDVCIALAYRILPDGSTGNFAMLKGWNSRKGDREPVANYWDTFSQSAAGAIGNWRFAWREQVKEAAAVDTVAILTFSGNGHTPTDQLRQHCAVPDRPLAKLMALARDDRMWFRALTNFKPQYGGRQMLDSLEAREAASGWASSQRTR